jgi:uncharacterized delta-60 repeat protein
MSRPVQVRSRLISVASVFGVVSLFCLVMTMAASTAASASPAGDIDPTFGTSGVVVLDYSDVHTFCAVGCGSVPEGVLDEVVQPDGGVLALTPHIDEHSAYHVALTRTDASGTPDAGFGDAGLVVLAASDPNNASTVIDAGLAAVADGDTLVFWAEPMVTTGESINVARVGPDGALDTSYGDAGVAHVEVPDVYWVAVSATPDGRAVVAGTSSTGAAGAVNTIHVARFTASGTLDPGFGHDGTAAVTLPDLYPNGRQNFGYAEDVVAHADGGVTVLARGSSSPGAGALVGFTPTGTPDQAYGPAGISYLDQASPRPALTFLFTPRELALDSKGRLLVGGERQEYVAAGNSVVVFRFDAAARLDQTFGVEGMAKVDLSPVAAVHEYVAGLAVDPTDRVVIGGYASSVEHQVSFAARFLEEGTLDPTFGTAGRTLAPMADEVTSVAVGPDGSVVLGGRAHHQPSPPDAQPPFGCGYVKCTDLWFLRLRPDQPAAADDRFVLLDGTSVIPGPGDPDGAGVGLFQINDDALCGAIRTIRIDDPTSAELLRANPGETGFAQLDITPMLSGLACVPASPEIITALRRGDPFAAQISTSAHPNGALRGQLQKPLSAPR